MIHEWFSRIALLKFMANLSRCRVGVEVCGERTIEVDVSPENDGTSMLEQDSGFGPPR